MIPKWKSRVWPIAVIAVLAFTVAANGVLLWASSGHNAAAVEPDYYHRAIAWDSILALDRHSAELGWTLDASIERPGLRGADLRVRLADANGHPLDHALVHVIAIHNADANRRIEGVLVTGADGAAVQRLALAHHGLWELRFDVQRGSERFVSDQRLERGDSAPELP